MAGIERVRLEQSVRASFAASRMAFLPPEILDDSTAAWVLNFDELLADPSEKTIALREDKSSFDARRIVDELVGERDLTNQNRDIFGLIFNDFQKLLQTTVSTKLDFYFSTLFVIGRFWKIGFKAAQSAGEALRQLPEARFELAAPSKMPFGEQGLRNFARQTLRSARDRGVATTAEARRFWVLWLKDVEPFKNQWLAYESALRELSYLADRAFARPDSAALLQQAQSRLCLLALFEDFGRPLSMSSSIYLSFKVQGLIPSEDVAKYDDSPYTEMVRHLHQYWLQHWSTSTTLDAVKTLSSEVTSAINRLSESIREGPKEEFQVQEYFREFRERYKGDPFAPYDVKPADQMLYQLVRESQGPGGVEIPWFSAWARRLPRRIGWGYGERLAANIIRNPDEHSSELTRSADATIKRAFMDTEKDGLESDADFLQRIFEKKWIEVLARQWNSEENLPKLDENILEKLLDSALSGLKTRGYSLVSPGKSRLRTLVQKVNRNEVGYSHRPEW